MDQIIYYSRGGNTKKVASAIADELQTNAVDVKDASMDGTEKGIVIFLGSGNYGGKPGPKMLDLIENNDFSNMKVALFGTSGSGKGSELQEMEAALKAKKAMIQGKYYCKGKTFGLINRGHPSNEELNEAKSFARKMIK